MSGPRTPRADLPWLALATLLLVGSAAGLGLRDPWPADEPRFAAVAAEMLDRGDWLFPRVGGDLYQDKPPLYFWLLAGALALTGGSIRAAFLLPSLLSAVGVVGLVHDLARRLAGRAAGLAGAATLLVTVQFLMAARSAQIDATLCLLTTLSLYGLLRHLLLGPAWGWYFAAGAAAGLGVITKGVGFLPLLVLLPYALLRRQGFEPLPRFSGGARWALAPAGLLLGVALWGVPMLLAVAASGDAALVAYRDEILFQQTVERYAEAWHHVRPWYYFLLEVIPPLWLPLSLLLPWLVPRWCAAWKARDARVWLPLAWAVLVLAFFSLSEGKRGIYILPALPALALAAAPALPVLFERRGVGRASLALAGVLLGLAYAVLGAWLAGVPALERALERIGLDALWPVGLFAAVGSAAWLVAALSRPLLAWPAVLACLALTWGFLVTPRVDRERSGRAFMEGVLAQVPHDVELGLAGYREQFLLHLDRPVVNFGHGRWREATREAYDAARWLNAAPGRWLLLSDSRLEPCFGAAPRQVAGVTSRERWSLVRGPAAQACAEQGDPARAIHYRPPSPTVD